jgi:SulP family sulfate permease
VAIKSGGATRITSIVHAVLLFISVIAIGPWISQIPLAALGGVLLVTTWRMNEWESIMFFARRRIGHALAGMLVTMLATVVLDLTQAILIGLAISAVMYVRQSAGSVDVRRESIDLARMRAQGHQLEVAHPDVHVYYLTGPIFFGSVHTVLEAFADAGNYRVLVISMRGVPMVDVMGAQALLRIVERQQHRGGMVFFSGVQPAVRQLFERTGLLALIGEDHVVWSADRAIMAVDALYRREAAGESSR